MLNLHPQYCGVDPPVGGSLGSYPSANRRNGGSNDRVSSFKYILRGGAVVARWAHNPKVGGSNPPSATKKNLWCESTGDF
jgi:hypothetical protein